MQIFDRDDGNFEQMPMHVELDAECIPQSLEVLKVVNLHAEKQGMEARFHCLVSPEKVDGMTVNSDIYLKLRFNMQ